MSYARWSECDVYVYASVYGFVECCNCTLTSDDFDSRTDGQFHSAGEVVAHMKEHIDAGHDVPEYLLDATIYPDSDFIERDLT